MSLDQEERRRKLQLSTQHLLMEAREKSRGWEGHPAPDHLELAFKKVNEGREPERTKTQTSSSTTTLTRHVSVRRSRAGSDRPRILWCCWPSLVCR